MTRLNVIASEAKQSRENPGVVIKSTLADILYAFERLRIMKLS
jgi:hypothetical protein